MQTIQDLFLISLRPIYDAKNKNTDVTLNTAQECITCTDLLKIHISLCPFLCTKSSLPFCLIYLGKSAKIEGVSLYATVKRCKTAHKKEYIKRKEKS